MSDELFNGDLLQTVESDDSVRRLAVVRLNSNPLTPHIDSLRTMFMSISDNAVDRNDLNSFLCDLLRFILCNVEGYNSILGVLGGHIEDFYLRTYGEHIELSDEHYNMLEKELRNIANVSLTIIEDTFNMKYIDMYNMADLFYPQHFVCFNRYFSVGTGDSFNHFMEFNLYHNSNHNG